MVLIACYLSLTGQPARSRELVWTIMLSLLIIVPLSGLLPVESAWLYYDVGRFFDAASIADFDRLRAGQLHDLDLRQLQGIISFPSFHTCLGLVFVYVVHKRRRVLLPLALLMSGTARSQSTVSLFTNTVPATSASPDTTPQTFGVKFSTSQPGTISAIRFYRGAKSANGYAATLYSADGKTVMLADYAGHIVLIDFYRGYW